MPRIALAPLFIVALGINTSAKVALASSIVFFLVLSGARAGVRSTDAELLRLSTVLGAASTSSSSRFSCRSRRRRSSRASGWG